MSLFNLPKYLGWKDVCGYEGIYKVNEAGQILRVGGKVRTKNENSSCFNICT